MTKPNTLEVTGAPQTTNPTRVKQIVWGLILGSILTLIAIFWGPKFLGPYPGAMICAGLFLYLCGALAGLSEAKHEGPSNSCISAFFAMIAAIIITFLV